MLMASVRLKFPRPVHVIQIFNNSLVYGKDEKSFAQRKDKYAWKDTILSKSGILEEGILKLNKSKMPPLDDNINVILLIDYNANDETEILTRFELLDFYDYVELSNISPTMDAHRIIRKTLDKIPYVIAGNFSTGPLVWDVLEFRKWKNIHIYLRWDEERLGMPKREFFKICELYPHKPVEILINGRKDFSGTKRRERLFVEKDYIIEYLGEVREYELIEGYRAIFQKQIPRERNVINLLKPLA